MTSRRDQISIRRRGSPCTNASSASICRASTVARNSSISLMSLTVHLRSRPNKALLARVHRRGCNVGRVTVTRTVGDPVRTGERTTNPPVWLIA